MLTENEKLLLETLRKTEEKLSIDELEKMTGLSKSTIMAIIELLKSRGAIREEAFIKRKYYLTKIGLDNLEKGLPEQDLIELLKKNDGRMEIKSIIESMGPRGNIAIGELKKREAIVIDKNQVVLKRDITNELSLEQQTLKEIHEKGFSENLNIVESLKKRGLIDEKIERVIKIAYVPQIADKLLLETKTYVTKLSSDDIITGRWKETVLKEYNVEAYPAIIYPGIEHFFELFLEKIRTILRDMGFREYVGNFILQEFWNFDILFQAQDHPSREIHDTFWLDITMNELMNTERELIEKVKNIHERGGTNNIRGWGGEWKEEIARRVILRTQMTSSTIKALSMKPSIPFRIFSIGRVFRPDQIDYKRLPEFTQLDGIICENGFTFNDLLSVLKDFFSRLGFEKVRFKPAYFPFTEPSVEGYIYFEGKGWVEVFGAGLFRPEIKEILGYEENIGAWGMGLERLAMKLIGVEDIRTFYSRDISVMRKYYTKALRMMGD